LENVQTLPGICIADC